MEANVENLALNLAEQGYDLSSTPCVMQYNKRDLPNSAPLAECQRLLNTVQLTEFEVCTTTGIGVFETLKSIARLVLRELKQMNR